MKISNLKKDFGGFSLNITSMDIIPGEIHGLIGSNGCGKTTLMKLIAGIFEPDGGEIDYSGLDRRDITMVPRKPYVLRDSVYNNLIYPLKIRKIKPDTELVGHYLKLAGLHDMRKRYAPALSSGEQQKLALIRALIFSPKLLLIDEAFSGIDIDGAEALERFILDRQRETAATWLVTSHQLSHIQRLCGHIFFMREGALEAEGPAEDMLLMPQNERLRAYLRYETTKGG